MTDDRPKAQRGLPKAPVSNGPGTQSVFRNVCCIERSPDATFPQRSRGLQGFQDKTISLPRALVPTARGVLAEWGLLRRSLDLRLGPGVARAAQIHLISDLSTAGEHHGPSCLPSGAPSPSTRSKFLLGLHPVPVPLTPQGVTGNVGRGEYTETKRHGSGPQGTYTLGRDRDRDKGQRHCRSVHGHCVTMCLTPHSACHTLVSLNPC